VKESVGGIIKLRFALDSAAVRLRSGCLELAVVLSVVLSVRAQVQLPTIRSEANVVLVPTLVRTRAGEIAYSLQSKDFVIEDNGVEQDVTLDESPEQEPVSLVVAIQVGHKASSQFKKRADLSLYDSFYSEEARRDCRKRRVPCPTAIAGLGTMLRDFMDQTKGEVALVTFDSSVYQFQGFTEDASKISERLTKLTPGDDGAAILDAVNYSARLLESRPRDRRRVLLLISESRDHGSVTTTALSLTQQLAASNMLVCSLTFSPLRGRFAEDLKALPSGENFDLLVPLRASIGTLRKNVAQDIAAVMGGEDGKFKDKTTFDATFASITNGIRGRYLLSFQPKQPKPGPHSIRVRLRDSRKDLVLRARSEYWATERQP
jgi:VWFA-related protein